MVTGAGLTAITSLVETPSHNPTQNKMFENNAYGDLSEFDRNLAQFGDRVSIIAGLEISGKMTPEKAYQDIKLLYKELKKARKGVTKDNG